MPIYRGDEPRPAERRVFRPRNGVVWGADDFAQSPYSACFDLDGFVVWLREEYLVSDPERLMALMEMRSPTHVPYSRGPHIGEIPWLNEQEQDDGSV